VKMVGDTRVRAGKMEEGASRRHKEDSNRVRTGRWAVVGEDPKPAWVRMEAAAVAAEARPVADR
jgi:hypothetical protein